VIFTINQKIYLLVACYGILMYKTRHTTLVAGVIGAFLIGNAAGVKDVFAPIAILPDIDEQQCKGGSCDKDSIADKRNKGQQGDIASEGKRQGHGGSDKGNDDDDNSGSAA
jgi:hypothetical protein